MKGLTKAMVIGVLAIAFLSIFTPKNSPIVGRMYCDVYFVMQNKERHCYGPVDTECGWPDPPWHNQPWGNWGVDSNVGRKIDDHQFQGWYPEDGWLQWNSCTEGDYAPPDCRYYNAASCTQQHTTTGENIYGAGSRRYEIPQWAWMDG
ncbi:MAG: hypothetical protein OEZ30_04365 [Candidatus Aminicenantes bacterium]|nr:hypothetical protein [Candidatus Aminicenantes bacterium]